MRVRQDKESYWICVMRLKIYTKKITRRWKVLVFGLGASPSFCACLAPRISHSHFLPRGLFTVSLNGLNKRWTTPITIHQTHDQKSDWPRASNQFTIACELDMINAISSVDIAFIMSSSTSAWLLSPLECSQKQNGWMLHFCL